MSSKPVQTRFDKITHKDLTNWRIWYDANKNRYEDTLDQLGFWQTLDTKVVAFSFKVPSIFGTLIRVSAALLGSNRYEPFPIGNWGTGGPKTKWKGKDAFIRWFRWHLRNPFSDLRKFYLGFAYASTVIHKEKKWGMVRWAKFRKIPFRIPFPFFECKYGHIGWEQRGIFSASL